MAEAVFVKEYESKTGETMIEHRDGVSWHEAPTRLRCLLGFHRTQTRGWTGYFSQTRRCSCGAMARDRYRFGNIDRGWRRRVLRNWLKRLAPDKTATPEA